MSLVIRAIILTTAILHLLGCSSSNTTTDTPTRLLWAEIEVPAVPASVVDGSTVYQEQCVSCHGETGRGDGPNVASLSTPPRDFSLALFKLRSTNGFPTDEDLYRTITVGFPAYGMPAFDTLSPEERWGLVHHVKALIQKTSPEQSLTPGTPIVLPEAPPYKQSSIDLGKVHYSKMGCAFCHGSKGEGNATIPLVDAQGNRISPRNFQGGPESFKGGGRPEDIVRILMTGMAGTPMQPYGRIGSANQELWHVAHYVHHLATTGNKDTP